MNGTVIIVGIGVGILSCLLGWIIGFASTADDDEYEDVASMTMLQFTKYSFKKFIYGIKRIISK